MIRLSLPLVDPAHRVQLSTKHLLVLRMHAQLPTHPRLPDSRRPGPHPPAPVHRRQHLYLGSSAPARLARHARDAARPRLPHPHSGAGSPIEWCLHLPDCREPVHHPCGGPVRMRILRCPHAGVGSRSAQQSRAPCDSASLDQRRFVRPRLGHARPARPACAVTGSLPQKASGSPRCQQVTMKRAP